MNKVLRFVPRVAVLDGPTHTSTQWSRDGWHVPEYRPRSSWRLYFGVALIGLALGLTVTYWLGNLIADVWGGQ